MAQQFDHLAPDIDAMTASFAARCEPETCPIEPTPVGCAQSIPLMGASQLHQRFRTTGPDRPDERDRVASLILGRLLARYRTGPYANVPSTAAGAEPSPPGAGTHPVSPRLGLAW